MNKEVKEYFNNEQQNFEKIKLKINKKENQKKKILSTFFSILIIGIVFFLTPQMYAKFQFNKNYQEYKRRNYISGSGEIATAYSEKINMDYVYNNDIGIKMDSIIFTDDTLKLVLNIKMPEDKRIDKKDPSQEKIKYDIGYIIYDEKNNIYDISSPLAYMVNENENEKYQKYLKSFFKEIGIKKKYEDIHIFANGTSNDISYNDDYITNEIKLMSIEGFPNSQKIYIRIIYFGDMIFKENSDEIPETNMLCNSEWNFELQTADKFLKREPLNLVLLDEIPKLKIEKFTVSETGTVLIAKKKNVVETMQNGKDIDNWGEVSDELINITDENGNIYYPIQGGTTAEKNEFYERFEIDKDILKNTTLYLNIKVDDENYTSELKIEE